MTARVVDDSYRGRPRSESIAAQLRAGKTVFLPNASSPGSYLTIMRNVGLRVRSHRTEIDGEKGIVVWTEPIEETK